MKLFLTNIKNIEPEQEYKISPERCEKVKRYKSANDKRRCIAAGLLIEKFLPNTKITTNNFGKPIAENGVCFNISHSGDYVLIAISDCDIGCDIQRLKYQNIKKIPKFLFNENELSVLRSSTDKNGAFFKMWTKKESFLKCIGEGFHRPAKSVDVSSNSFFENGTDYYFRLYSFSDYIISICSKKNIFPDYIEFVEEF